MNRKAVAILGMHRSGTSTASGMFHLAGFDLGRSVTGGNPANPKGFFENYRLLFFHDDLLRYLGTDWHHTAVLPEGWWDQEGIGFFADRLKSLISDDFGAETSLLFKDPRLCILLPLYLRVFNETGIKPHFVIMYRDPDEVSQSLAKRDSFPAEKSARMWTDHMLRAELYTRGYPRSFLNYSDVLVDPVSALNRVVMQILPEFHPDPGLEERLRDFVEPVLNHNSLEQTGTPAGTSLQDDLSRIMHQAGQTGLYASDFHALDRLHAEFYNKCSAGIFPGVTVITPFSGESGKIGLTVQSVAGQDYPNLTHLIVDRCGSGGPGAFPEEMKYLVFQILDSPDMTFGEAMNAGADAASGEWLAVLFPGEVFPDARFVSKLMGTADGRDAIITGEDTGFSPFLMIRKHLADSVFPEMEGGAGAVPQMIHRLNAVKARVQTNV